MPSATSVLIALALLAPSAAFAQIPADPKARKAYAEAQVEKGYEHFQAGEFEAAVAAFERAYVANPEPKLQLNIGAAYETWGGHCAEAVRHFERFFKVCAGCAEEGSARRRQAQLMQRCTAEVTIGTDPPGATIEVDGTERGKSPLTLKLTVGPHVVAAALEGRRPVEQAFNVKEGAGQTLQLAFDPPAAPAPAPSAPAASASEPAEPAAEAGVGAHEIGMWASFGAGAAGLAMGAWFLVAQGNAIDDEKKARADGTESTSRIEGLRDEALSDTVLAQVGFGIGAAGVIAGAVLFATADDKDAVSLLPGPGSLSIVGRF